jgi:hypothetical protein
MPDKQRPNRAVAGSSKWLAGQLYQLKTVHCLTRQTSNGQRTGTLRSAGGVRIYKTQTQEHLFKSCPRWKPQQKILWAEVRKETDLFADERLTRSILDFVRATDVGRKMKPGSEEGRGVGDRRGFPLSFFCCFL